MIARVARRVLVACLLACVLACVLAIASTARAEERVAVGSKAFPESWILGEALRSLAAASGATAEHRKNLGGTEIVVAALRAGDVDVYVEYTGTIDEVVLPKRDRARTSAERRSELGALGLSASEPLGFNDGYALAVVPRAGVTRVSELASRPELRFGLTHEFLGRRDGFPGLSERYALAPRDVRGMQHDLAFEAIGSGAIDVTDVYTTDAQIARLGLVVLDDDRAFFPRYDALLLYKSDLPSRAPRALAAMLRLVGAIDAGAMTRANAALVIDRRSVEDAAAMLAQRPASIPPSVARAVAIDTARHLELVAASLAAAIVVGLPLGVLAARRRAISALVLGGTGVLQTVPSLALLALLIPLLGIGRAPAVAALFLYGLLPIVRGTYTGITTIAPSLDEAADAIGLSAWSKLRRVSLPLASPAIVAGVKTSAVIGVGTATVAALVGAEGLGNPILQGISLRDTALILRGALPAAALALAVEAGFSVLERVVVPRALRGARRAKETATRDALG